MRKFLEGLTTLTVRPGLSYPREYGPRFDMRQISQGRPFKRASVEITRYIVDAKPGNLLVFWPNVKTQPKPST